MNRLPGWVWTDGQDTDSNGAYRFSVPPGTYVLQVQPRGPLIAQEIELSLSTNTTRNIVLEAGVTLSGRVVGPAGQPVPWAWLAVRDDADAGQQAGFGSADASGRYSLGVPAGTYRIDVYSEDFLDTTLEGVEVSQDTVLNIALEAGVLLEGKVVDDKGQPVSAWVCAHLLAEQWWEGFCAESESEGHFQLRVAPAVYVVAVTPLAPLQPTRRRLEVSSQGVSDIVLTVGRQPMPFVPDDPPEAALISISSPTADGEVTLTGAAGSVAPNSAVVAITLDTGHVTTAQATTSGSFTAALFAPPGTSILIKADPLGTNMARFEDEFFNPDGQNNHETYLPALPGTILRVADPQAQTPQLAGREGPVRKGPPSGRFTARSIPRRSPPAIPCGSKARSGWTPRLYRGLMRYKEGHCSGLNPLMDRVLSLLALLLPPPS